MQHASRIIMMDATARAEARAYEEHLGSLSLSEKLSDCQSESEEASEGAIAKVLLLFLMGGEEISHEVRRVFSWRHRAEKAAFLIVQLASPDPDVVLGAIDLLGVLRQPVAIPSLDAKFSPGDAEVGRHIIDALAAIGWPLGFKTIVRALASPRKLLVLHALRLLSRRADIVPWRTFRQLLFHPDGDIRSHAAFAIGVRKAEKSARCLLRAIGREGDPLVRRHLIASVGNVPSAKLLSPLLAIAVRDRDQKARLAASRTLDRLQGILPAAALFRLRHVSDVAMRAEVLFRLGKFGSDIVRHKAYLRATLSKGGDVRILQACLQALGAIADRSDIDLLADFLLREPFLAYNAAMALVRILRLEDRARVLAFLRMGRSPIIKQIFLRYLFRRGGCGVEPAALLEAVIEAIEGEQGINTRYLGYRVLEHAPTEASITFLLSALRGAKSAYEREAVENSLVFLMAHHWDVAEAFLRGNNRDTCGACLRFLPRDLGEEASRDLAAILAQRCGEQPEEAGAQQFCHFVLEQLVAVPAALRAFVAAMPHSPWRLFLLRSLMEHADRGAIACVEGELVGMLAENDPELRALAMMLLTSLKDIRLVPRLIAIAESDPREKMRKAAGHIAAVTLRGGLS